MGDIGTGAPSLTLEKFQVIEDEALKAFAHVTDERFAAACEAFRGTVLYSHPEGCWNEGDLDGLKVCGTAGGGPGSTVVEFDAKSALSGALVHELAHVVQFSAPPYVSVLPADPNHDESHADWGRRGIDTAISESYYQTVAIFKARQWFP